MAIIFTYPKKSNPVDNDLVLISDSEDSNKTKQVTISDIKGATAGGVTQIVAGTNITISPVTGTGVVTINSSGGGGGTPGGSDTQMQYNNGGSFGGTTGLTWDDSTNILSIATRYEGDIDGAVLQQVLVKESGGVSKGDVVYISGGTGDNPEVMKAQANSVSTMAALGIMKENVALDAVGECVTSGEITGVDLTGFTTGDELFVSNTTAGGLLTSAPTGEANLIQKIGKVIKGGAGGALTVLGAFRTNATPNLNQGSLFIGNASNQTSTLAISPSSGYVLTSNGTTASWQALPASGGVTSFTNAFGTYISGTANTSATGAVTIGTIDLNAVDGTAIAGTRFLSKDNTWDVPAYTVYNVASSTTNGLMRIFDDTEQTESANAVTTETGRTYGIQFNSDDQAVVNVPWTDTDTNTTYTLQADAKVSTSVPLKLDASTGTDSTVNLTEGANVTLTRNSANEITIAAAGGGGSSKLGFTPLSIYGATHEISSGQTGKTIYRQSVVETDCTIDKVDFFVTAVTGLSNVLTVAVYVGNLTTATRVLLGTSGALSTGMNTITFTAPHTFSAGDDIVIYTSQSGSEEENNSIAGDSGLLNNALLSRGDASYDASPVSSIGPPENPTAEGLALHFYDE